MIAAVADDVDAIFEAVRARVVSGEYLDSMLGLPGVATDGGGAFQQADDGRLQRMYWRYSAEYRAARAAGIIQMLPPLTPVPPDVLARCEASMGVSLPLLLRRCYLELGDGGFGPGYGLHAVASAGAPHGTIGSEFANQEHWPEPWRPMAGRLVPVCAWGCGIASFVDCTDPDARMWALDPNPAPGEDVAEWLFPQEFGFTEWLRRWTDGQLEQPWLLRDTATGRWRGATDSDYEPLPIPAATSVSEQHPQPSADVLGEGGCIDDPPF
ncbi:hypothetical protein ACU686_12045 [Yinghuangia aomiensis]